MRIWNSIEFRLKIVPFISLGLAIGLALPAVRFLKWFDLLPEGPLIEFSMTLFFMAFISVMVQLILIPFILLPLKNFQRKLVGLNDRKHIQNLKPEQFPEFEVAIKTLNDYFAWAEKQTSMASMIHQAIREKAQRAERDIMTGLYNKAYLYNYLPDELSRCHALHNPLSLIIMDIDHFKHYNDTNGHPAGDDVLIRIAELLKTCVRDLDICVRYGGEEFIIILPKSGSERARKIAQRLRQIIQNMDFEHNEKQPLGRITASFGVSTFPDCASNVEDLIETADQALYQSKHFGRNRVMVYGDKLPKSNLADPELDIEIINRSELG